MKLIQKYTKRSNRNLNALLAMTVVLLAPTAGSAAVPEELDNFNSESKTSLETPRMVINDAGIGGKSEAKLTTENGILQVTGTLAPGRGQPGFVSLVLLLSETGVPQDLSAYEGIRLKVRVLKGGLQVLAASAKVQNFDYHTAAVARSRDFQEIKVPFSELKRVWSEPMPLDLSTITSINLVASGMQPGTFAYEIDEIGFY